VKRQEPDQEELLEVSQIRPRSKVSAQLAPRSSPLRRKRVGGRGLAMRFGVGFAAAILTATPADAPTSSTAELVTSRVVNHRS
jgi:hypothetical protein